jgi:hypothetical protein
MADVIVVNAGPDNHLSSNIGKNSVVTCVYCIQLESQLGGALSQLKSLQKVIRLLQQDSEQNKVLKKVNFGGIVGKCVNMKHNEVGNASMNNSTSYTGNSYENDANIVINSNEVLDMFNDTRHRGNSSISSVNTKTSSNMSASNSNSKTILQVNSSVKWSDVVADRAKLCHQSSSASLHNIPTIINSQVLPSNKPVPKYKTKKLAAKSSATDNHPKDHKILLLSDSHGRGCTERIKYQLSSNFEVCGCVKPGVTSSSLANSAPTKISKLT